MRITETELNAMVRAIVEAIQPERIVLFGSLARGDATEDSDVDLLIVEREGFAERSRWRELERIRDLLAAFSMPKDVLLYSQDEVAHWQSSTNHIIAHAMKEGRFLHGRP